MHHIHALIAATSALSLLWTCTAAQASSASAVHELTRADLESWLNGFLPFALDQGDIAGAVVVVVKDGQVLLQQGYGYADVQKRKPVDPDRTLFRPGSISKLFTWTAVMQQVEQGKLDLDRDINDYLDFKIPPTFGKPITLRHLMTHTPGFEDVVKGQFRHDLEGLPSLERYSKSRQPARIYAPGEVPAYSNYGTTLAGYIVQRVSGEDFNTYLERHIFRPLGMQRSTFRQPLPEPLAADMAMGYRLGSGVPAGYELVGPAPAGSLAATGADIARFMIAHLQTDLGAQGSLLRSKTARLMHATANRALAPLNGFTLGFFESDLNGRRIISHGGDTEFFHSDLSLFLDERVGLFFSINSSGRADADLNIRMALFDEFTDRYFPASIPQEPTAATALEHAHALAQAGPYRFSIRNESSFLAFAELLGQMQINVNDDGTIVVPAFTGYNGRPRVWREVEPYVWREVGGKRRLAARVVNARVQALGFEPFVSIAVLQPVPTSHSATWNLPLLLSASAVLLLTVIHWPVTALLRRHYGTHLTLAGRELRACRWARVAALINLVFVLGWALVILAGDVDWASSLDVWLRLLQLVGCIGVAGTGVVIWNAWLTWNRARGWWAKAWSVLLAAACLAVIWFAFAFKLITVSLNY
jgi:CubicO group peptidase (beta-lactamase class C family)